MKISADHPKKEELSRIQASLTAHWHYKGVDWRTLGQ